MPNEMASEAEREREHGEGEEGADEERQRQLALQRAGGRLFGGHNHRGISVCGWTIEAKKRSILKVDAVEQWEKALGTSHLPEMVFGDSVLELVHTASGVRIFFNAYDALCGWKEEALPPVEVPAAAKWKFRSKPSQEIILDYDYTFTTPYNGSETLKNDDYEQAKANGLNLKWTECDDRIDLVALQARDPILFYDEVVLYEDELADNGVSLLSVKVRVMPSCWFLLLRFWLRVDGVLMRLRDTRMHCSFQHNVSKFPTVLRERCVREGRIKDLMGKGIPPDMLADKDGSLMCDKLPVCKLHIEKLEMTGL